MTTDKFKKHTGSLLKKTIDVRVSTNHRFFHEVHPNPDLEEDKQSGKMS